MKKLLSALFCVAAATLALSVPASAQVFAFEGFLNGANEVPAGSGDMDASANAFVSFNTATETLTWRLTNIQNLDGTFRFWHIHTGAAGSNGPVLVDFGASFTGTDVPYTAAGTNATEVSQIIANPAGHYFNVHTTTFPPGAVRGQLVVVPEAGTLALAGFGLLGTVGIAVRRRIAK